MKKFIKNPKRSHKGQEGQILVLFVGFSLVMILLVAFLVGLATYLYAQQQLDAATGQAALAAAEWVDPGSYNSGGGPNLQRQCAGPFQQGYGAQGGPAYAAAQNILAGNQPKATIPTVPVGLSCAADGTVILTTNETITSPLSGLLPPGSITLTSIQIAKYNPTFNPT